MKRREFISLLGGAAAVWPLASQAQQRERVRRIGVLMHLAVDDPDGQSRLAAFLQGLQEAGWAVGRNVAIEVRWAAADIESMNRFAKELVAHQPDLIFVTSTPATAAMVQATRTIPVIFVLVADPVGRCKSARFTDRAQRAKCSRDKTRRLAGGLCPWCPTPTFRYFPGSPC
jgi:putative ABC transport system substrate-binding protein